MVININPNRIGQPAGGSKAAERKRQQAENDSGAGELARPSRAELGYIPGPESLHTLVSSAVAALRKGVRWERGTILNILV